MEITDFRSGFLAVSNRGERIPRKNNHVVILQETGFEFRRELERSVAQHALYLAGKLRVEKTFDRS